MTCLLIAAKLEEDTVPSYHNMIRIFKELDNKNIKKQEIVDLEESIGKTLDFNLRDVSSIHFLDRFLRLFGIDQEDKDESASKIASLARKFCGFMQRRAQFLKYRPS